MENNLAKVGVMLSGGLDSSILLAHLLQEKRSVQPFYIRTDLNWQVAELRAVHAFLTAIASPNLEKLVVLQMPLIDLYQDHWSVSGSAVPDANSQDEAVFLPGRNALLLIKAAVWCQMQGIRQLALAPLGTSPFYDAQPPFFENFAAALNCGDSPRIEIIRPFAEFSKQQVMELGRNYPLQHTFSCIAPRLGRHCGQCNKCAERKQAFSGLGLVDPTEYATARTSSFD